MNKVSTATGRSSEGGALPRDRKATRMTGARFLADTLNAYGVTHTFMVPAVLRRTMAEMERRTGIKNIHTHGEKSAAYMADGFARASGRPGVCMAQEVGVLNLAAGLRDAWLAHSPVIALTGGRRQEHRYRKLYQDAEDISALDPYTKMNVSVDLVSRFPDLMRQAFRVATTGCPGPVHLQFWGQEGEIDQQEDDLEVIVESQFRQVPAFRPLPNPADVTAAVQRIASAARPIVIAGGGARASGASQALRRFVDLFQIPVATSLNGRDTFPDYHDLSVGVVGTYSRESANRAVSEADLVILLGTEAGSMTTNFWRLPDPTTSVIQIDIEPEAIGRNYVPDIGIHGDVRTVLEQLIAIGPAAKANADWLNRIAQLRAECVAKYADVRASDDAPIRPERICRDLSVCLPDDAVVVVDTGHAGMWMGAMFDLRSPGQSYIRSAGHLGWAFPAGLGAKCAVPDRPVVTFTGDLGIWYHIAEIETAVRWNINAVTVVNNNRSGNQSRRGFSIAYEGKPTEKSRELWVHNEVNFAALAEQIGALGIRVDKPKDIRPAIEQAIAANRPAVIDVVTDIEAAAPTAWDPGGWMQRY